MGIRPVDAHQQVGADRARRILPHVKAVSGTNGNPRDPVIVGAGRVQGALAVWVHLHGALPWLLVLALVVLGAVGLAWRRWARRLF